MDVTTILTRALSGIGKDTIYSSPGKMPSFASNVWPQRAHNDCSGFVSWCLRFSESRKVDHPLYKRVNGGWFETTAIYRDGIESTGYFRQLDSGEPGALLVYPDYIGADGKSHDGHIGIVIDASGKGVKGVNQVVHCSLGNYMHSKDAIQISDPQPWLVHINSSQRQRCAPSSAQPLSR